MRATLSAGLLCLTLSLMIYILERLLDRWILFSAGEAAFARGGSYQRVGIEIKPLANPFFWLFAALGVGFFLTHFFTPITTLVLTGPVEPPADDLDPGARTKK